MQMEIPSAMFLIPLAYFSYMLVAAAVTGYEWLYVLASVGMMWLDAKMAETVKRVHVASLGCRIDANEVHISALQHQQ